MPLVFGYRVQFFQRTYIIAIIDGCVVVIRIIHIIVSQGNARTICKKEIVQKYHTLGEISQCQNVTLISVLRKILQA